MKNVGTKAFTLTALLLALGAAAFAQEPSQLIILEVQSVTADPGETAARYAVDGDARTAWAPAADATRSGLLLTLDRPCVINAITVDGVVPGDASIRVEYFEGSEWKPFAAGLPQGWQGGTIDVSGDLVETDRIALRFERAPPRIFELGVQGLAADSVTRIMKPARLVSEHSGHPFYRIENVSDGNPRTTWGPGWGDEDFDWAAPYGFRKDLFERMRSGSWWPWFSQGTSVQLEYDEPRTVDELRVYTPPQFSRTLVLSGGTDHGWRVITTLQTTSAGGWSTVTITGGSTAFKRFLLAAADQPGKRWSVGEIELWGRGGHVGRLYTVAEPMGAPGASARDFEIRLSGREPAILELVADHDLGETLSVQLNGFSLDARKVRDLGNVASYEVEVTRTLLAEGPNWVHVLLPADGGSILSCRVRSDVHDALYAPGGNRGGDGSLSTAITAADWIEYRLDGTLFLSAIDVFSDAPGSLEVQLSRSGERTTLLASEVGVRYARYLSSSFVDAIYVRGPGNLYEVRVWASPTTDRAPTVQIFSPAEDQGWRLGDNTVFGRVDDPDATVTVNDTPARMHDGYFAARVEGDQAATVMAVTATATDSSGRTGSDSLLVNSAGSPALKLDSDGVFLTETDTVTISGSASSGLDVSVDGVPVQVHRGRFSASLSAPAGMSLHRVEARSRGGRLLAFAIAKVAHYTTDLTLRIDSPDRPFTNQKSIRASGRVSGAGKVKVWVNGSAASVEGGSFRTTTLLTLHEGDNQILVRATDSLNRSATQIVVVRADFTKPVITITDPASGAFEKSPVLIEANVSDASAVSLAFNGAPAALVDGVFSLRLDFADGQATVSAVAADHAGNTSAASVTFTADTTPPLPFEISFLPSSISNQRHTLILFSANDLTSGVASYSVSVDGATPVSATSLHETPELDDGAHVVAVQAFDRAGNALSEVAGFQVDTVAPPAPPLLRAVSADGRITLMWESASEDTVLYRISREPAWADGDTRETAALEYRDQEVTNGQEYAYAVTAIDHATNEGLQGDAWTRAGSAEVAVDPANDVVVQFDRSTLFVPLGALPEGVEAIRATEVYSEELAALAAFPPVTPMYEFTPTFALEDAETGHVVLAKDAVVLVEYSPGEIPEGFPEQNLGVYYFDEDWSTWVQMKNAAVDVERNLIVFSTDHFSIFTVMPTPIQGLSPQEIRDKGYSPLASISRHHGVNVSTQGGTARASATEFTLPGKNGFTFSLGRQYDTGTARADSEKLLVNTQLAFTIGQGLTSGASVQSYIADFSNASVVSAQNISKFTKLDAFSGAYAYSMGIGWRLDLPFVTTTQTGVSVRLPGGGTYSVTQMTPLSSGALTAYNKASTDKRVLALENHQGEDFTFLVYQAKTTLSPDSSLGRSFSLPAWTTTKAVAILKDGSSCTFNADGSVSQIQDAQRLNTLSFTYRADRTLDTMTDSLGHTLTFTYDPAIGFTPRITRITVSSADGRTRSVSYTQQDIRKALSDGTSFATLPLLVRATDPAGRTWSYGYDNTLLVPGDEGGGVEVNLVTAIARLGHDTDLQGMIQDVTRLRSGGSVGVAYFLSSLRGPGVGSVALTTQQIRYTHKNGLVTLLAGEEVLSKPEGTSLARLFTTRVDERSSQSDASRPAKVTTFSYHMAFTLDGQTYADQATISDGSSTVVEKYQAWRRPVTYYDRPGTGFECVPYEVERKTYKTASVEDTSVPYETAARTYYPATLRLASETRLRTATLFASTAYVYDGWGNLTEVTHTNGYGSGASVAETSRVTTSVFVGASIPVQNLVSSYLGIPVGTSAVSGTVTERYIQGLPVSEVTAFSVPGEAQGSAGRREIATTYDTKGRPMSRTITDGQGNIASTTFAYSMAGLPASTTRQVSESQEHTTTHAYDFEHLASGTYAVTDTEEEVETTPGAVADLASKVTFDALSGQKTREDLADGTSKRYEYDAIGRITRMAGPHDAQEAENAFTVVYSDSADTLSGVNYDLLASVTGARGQTDQFGYDSLGRLLVSRQSVRATDGEGRVITQNPPAPAVLVVTAGYDAQGRIISITDQNSVQTNYGYDEIGQLTEVDLPPSVSGGARAHVITTREEATNTVTTVDERGYLTIQRSDLDGHLVSEERHFTDVRGASVIARTSTRYDGLGQQVWKEDERGNVTLTEYDGLGRVSKTLAPSVSSTQVSGGQTQTFTGLPTTEYEYNSLDAVVRETLRNGTVSHVTTKTVNALGWVLATETTVTDPDTGLPTVVATRFEYDRMGRKIKEYDAKDLTVGSQTSLRWEYTARGKVSAEYDRAGAVTRYSYDLDDNVVKVVDPRETAGSAKYTGTYAYDDASRVVLADMPAHSEGTDRARTAPTYDARGNVVRQSNPDGTVTSWTYSPRNKAESQTLKDSAGGVLSYTTYTYDSGAYLSESVDGGLYSTLTEYDGLGRLMKTTVGDSGPEKTLYNAAGDALSRWDGNGNETCYTYDALGRVVTDRDAAGGTRGYEYDAWGNVSRTTDAKARAMLTQYDELGRLVEETRADGAKYGYRHDLAGNVSRSTDPLGTTTSYEYYSTYRLQSVTKTLGNRTGSASYDYDAAGNLTSATLDGMSATYGVNAYGERTSVARGGKKVSYTLEPFGRMAATTVSDGAATLSTTSYQYSAGSFLSSVTGWVSSFEWNQAGGIEVIQFSNATRENLYYTPAGRVESVTWTGSGGSSAVLPSYIYAYDGAGNVTGKNGGTYAYDSLSRLTDATEKGPYQRSVRLRAWAADTDYAGVRVLEIAPEAATVVLDAGSTSIGASFSTAVEVTGITLVPDALGSRVTSANIEVYLESATGVFTKVSDAQVSVSQADGSIQVTLAHPTTAYGVKLHCLYDERRIDYSVDTSLAGFSNSADAILRVQYLERNRVARYSYDAAGNRTSRTVTESLGVASNQSYQYWENTDRVKSDGRYSYSFDANGNMTEKLGGDGQRWRYSYDLWNRMAGVEYQASDAAGGAVRTVSYTYDPEGMRIGRSASGVSTEYWYGTDGNVVADRRTAGSATRLRAYAWVAGKLIGYDEVGTTTIRYWTATDALGSVTAETAAGGALVGRREYEDFGGAALLQTVAAGHESLVSYTGKEWDEEASLYYFNARWMDPELGRFTTEDPAKDQANWYAYVGNNPLTSTDPTGLLTDIDRFLLEAATGLGMDHENVKSGLEAKERWVIDRRLEGYGRLRQSGAAAELDKEQGRLIKLMGDYNRDVVPSSNEDFMQNSRVSAGFEKNLPKLEETHPGIDLGPNRGTPASGFQTPWYTLNQGAAAEHGTSSPMALSVPGTDIWMRVKHGDTASLQALNAQRAQAGGFSVFSPGQTILNFPLQNNGVSSTAPHFHLEMLRLNGGGNPQFVNPVTLRFGDPNGEYRYFPPSGGSVPTSKAWYDTGY